MKPATDSPSSAYSLPGLRPALAVFTAVLLARLWLVLSAGGPVPYWDEWAQARDLFLPWLDGTLGWHDLFAPHNEHRPVLTRLLALGLFVLNDHVWPVWPQLVANSLLHAACAALLTAFFARPAPRAFAIGLALVFICPAGWQNALWGFQSQVYLGNLLAVVALGALLLAPPLSARWWIGPFAATLALFTQGSGVFVSAISLLFTSLLFFADSSRRPRRRLMVAAAVLASILALGVLLRVAQPAHDPLFAKTPAQFLAVFLRCLGWPWVDSPWAWIVLQAPLVALACRHLRRRSVPSATDRLALALGLLVLLHAAAVAYTRAAGLADCRPLSRYQDPLLLGMAAQLHALFRLAPLEPRITRPACLLWTGTLLTGLLALTQTNLALNIPYKRQQNHISLSAIRTYLATRDPAALVIEPSAFAPYPDRERLRGLLDDPRVMALLPPPFFITTAAPSDTPASVPSNATPVSTARTPPSTSSAPTPIRAD